jgi:hypothetical protein
MNGKANDLYRREREKLPCSPGAEVLAAEEAEAAVGRVPEGEKVRVTAVYSKRNTSSPRGKETTYFTRFTSRVQECDVGTRGGGA